MDYKNFFLRSFFSFLFLSLYITICFVNFNLVFYLILFLYVLIFFEIYFYFKKYNIIPLLYIFISLTVFYINSFNNNSFIDFNLFVFIVVTFDTFSYIFGKSIGRNRLIKISPNKTIEGFLGGLLTSLILSLTVFHFLKFTINIELVLYVLSITLFAFIGDIIESFFKRKNNLKNSSELIPGHGGIFDRFDSFLFSIICYSITHNILT
tara:strand:- start:700 stop:1323 length:624 start_codon:yes stop_codon:yes gene_type:complete